MTAEEKAEDLVEKFLETMAYATMSLSGKRAARSQAKTQALIAVDEIISAIKQFHTGAEWQLMETMAWTYWHKVKDEINAL